MMIFFFAWKTLLLPTESGVFKAVHYRLMKRNVELFFVELGRIHLQWRELCQRCFQLSCQQGSTPQTSFHWSLYYRDANKKSPKFSLVRMAEKMPVTPSLPVPPLYFINNLNNDKKKKKK